MIDLVSTATTNALETVMNEKGLEALVARMRKDDRLRSSLLERFINEVHEVLERQTIDVEQLTHDARAYIRALDQEPGKLALHLVTACCEYIGERAKEGASKEDAITSVKAALRMLALWTDSES